MRILHVVPSYLPAVRYGGPIASVHGLCRAQVRRGHDVHVFTTSVDGDVDSPVPVDRPVLLDGVSVRYFRAARSRRLFWAPQLRSALNRQVESFSLVHTHSVFLWPTWAAAGTARSHNIPYLVAPRGMLVQELVQRRSALAKKVWIAAIERKNLERAAGVHVTSEHEKAELAKFQFSLPPLHVVPNGVDPAAWEQPVDEPLPPAIEAALNRRGPTLLYVGRVNWKKGLDRLIRALCEIPDATLLVVGNDEESYTPELTALATTLGVGARVVFAAALHGAAKTLLFRRATAFVLSSYSENFGNVVLEALAASCPVVVTPEVGAAAVVADSGGGLVVSGEPSVFAAGVRELLRDADRRRDMGSCGRAWVIHRCSWDAVAALMDSAYEDAILRTRGTQS